ncbi:MAG TPA: SRPBCC family protein [Solirubrobacteraceae bacterium]|nr:SRPBCC family protein [Solirubrobacteraceae bacterium]
MAKSGDVLEMPQLGVRVEVRRAAETGGELVEFDVIGRARGFLAQPHVHTRQTERFEPLAGALRLVVDGAERVLRPGEVAEVPPGTVHRQLALDDGGAVRVTVRPAATTEAFLERLAALCRDGRITRRGFPRPVAAAELVRDFGDDGHAAQPPVPVQRALAAGILGAARAGRAVRARAERASGEYVFVDEWDVAAPPRAVFDALADARTYPQWWTPVYIDVDADGPPALGQVSRQHFKGRLPYHLHTTSTITRLEPPHVVQGDVEGDLRGRGTWTLTPTATGTHVRFDWRVFADRPLLRTLTPALRPLFRWNHNWAIARAMDGLESYARGTTANAAENEALPKDALPSAG